MSKLNIGFVAAPFGFGPSAKAIAISSRLNKRYSTHFFSSASCVELAGISQAFSSAQIIDFQEPKSLRPYLNSLDAVISINTTRYDSVIFSQNTPHYFVDTLAWARSCPPPLIENVERYFIQNFFDYPMEGQVWHSPKIKFVGIIRQERIDAQSNQVNGSFVHIGGLFSPAISEVVCHSFLMHVIDLLAHISVDLTLLLPPQFGRLKLELPENINVLHCTPNNIQSHLSSHSFSITTPGIEHVYESLVADLPTLLLPPFNTSQVLQTRYFAQKIPEMVKFSGIEVFDQVDYHDLVLASKHTQEIAMDGVWEGMFMNLKKTLPKYVVEPNDDSGSVLREKQQGLLHKVSQNGAEIIACDVDKCLA